MPTFSPEALLAALHARHQRAEQHWCIALSGGLDSVALLHAMAALRALHPSWSMRAIHVDHQLQPQSGEWARHCKVLAEALGVPCAVRQVRLTGIDEQGIEAAARRARYEVFAADLQAGEVLLTAHHADDQLETLLIALMRGSGLSGLASMPAQARFAAGVHLRPLLDFTRTELADWAAAHEHIAFVEDPSNRDTRFDRNFLRHQVIPLLKLRWPSAAATVSRSAQHIAEADALLDEWADQDLRTAVKDQCLSIAHLRELDAPRRRLLLRRWIQLRGLLLPSTRMLAAMEHDFLQAADDRIPCMRWSGAEVHRYRDWLYAEPSQPAWNMGTSIAWQWRLPISLPFNMGNLRMTDVLAAGLPQSEKSNLERANMSVDRLPDVVTIRFRCGGERIRLPGEDQHRQLKKLLQASNVLPWWRERLPLIYAGEQLVAVADLWVNDEFAARPADSAVRVSWDERPNIFARV